MSVLLQVRAARQECWQKAKDLADRAAAAARNFNDEEQRQYDQLSADLDRFDARIKDLVGADQRAKDATGVLDGFRGARAGGPGRNPLGFTAQSLDALQSALTTRTAGRFIAADTEERASLITTTFGAPRAWGSNVLSGPRLLHVVAGVPQQQTDAVLAQHPNLTLPTALGSVGENVALAEFAASTAGSVTLARFGRWTDMSRESGFGTDAGAIIGMHQIGIALDLDNVLINAVEAAAGAAVAFTADVPAAIRSALARVISATASSDAGDLVVLVHPDNAALLQDVTPIGGSTIAEGFQRFSGALVYPSTAVDTGLMTVANLRVGARFFEAQNLRTETDEDVKTGTLTTATSVIAGYGVGLTGGFASKVDVVTP